MRVGWRCGYLGRDGMGWDGKASGNMTSHYLAACADDTPASC